jgi:hypothetical protein
VIDQLYKTNNSRIVTDLINQHIYRWIDQISDISNESEGSVKRLQEYKEIINELNTTINKYALTNKVQLTIDENKKKRWSDSFGFDTEWTIKSFSIKSTLNLLFGGYSKLQNEYFIKKLGEKTTYETEFPKKVFENIDALRENACDSVETTIDDVLKVINGWLSVGNWSQDEKTPMSGYYELDEENTIVNFSKTLIESYNYPKEKVISFLKNYILNRYRITQSPSLEEGAIKRAPARFRPGGCGNAPTNYARSYCILLDTWLIRWSTDGKRPWFNNLYYINQSYLHTSANLDPTLDYYAKENGILAIPNYLGSLILSDEVVVVSDSEEYSSAEEENK